jgi:hypothetical protein
MAEYEPTIGEVYRLIVAVQTQLRDMQKDLIGRGEYSADKAGIERRFQGLVEDQGELKADIATVKAESATGVRDLAKRMDDADRDERQRKDDLEKEQRQNRSTRTLAIVMAAASPILAIIVGILFNPGGAG